MSVPARKILELAPRKPPLSATSPFTPKDLRSLLPGLPQGAITEISGVRSSGRTTFFYSCLAAATAAGELTALIDGSDAFDPVSAEAAGIQLNRLLWVQCHRDPQQTLKTADLVLHGAAFRLIVLDLCDFAPRDLDQIPMALWHRLRLSIANTPASMIVACPSPVLRQSAAMQIELAGRRVHWSTLLEGADLSVRVRKPVQTAGGQATLRARAI